MLKKHRRDERQIIKKRNKHNYQFSVGEKVLIHNTRKASTKQKGNLEPNYVGPYLITKIDGKRVTVKNKDNQIIKTKYNSDRLKVFRDGNDAQQNTETKINSHSDQEKNSEEELKVSDYVSQIRSNGTLKKLLDFVIGMNLSHPTNLATLNRCLKECPVQSFIAEVSSYKSL